MALARQAGRRGKYNAHKTTVDGITFDSKKEARRWQELKLLERAGEIEHLERQVKVELIPAFDVDGKHYRAVNYIADFLYWDCRSKRAVCEDCKGFKTDVYRLKAKLFAYKFGVSILET